MFADIQASLKGLRLHGMAMAWEELTQEGPSTRVEAAKWLVEH